MINIVIPMAGAGSRFAKAGYKKPKPFIDVLGKPMICHVLDNLNIPDAKFILLTRFEHYNNEQETVKWIKSNYKVEFVIFFISKCLHNRGFYYSFLIPCHS